MTGSITNGNVDTIITCNNIKIPTKVTSAINNILVKSTDSSDVIRDQDTSFNLDNIIANDLGQTTKQINHLSQKAGSTTSLTTTIRQFSNALISSDKIHISGFTSDYVFNDGGTTTCTVTSNSNQISSTTSTDTSGTNRILIVTLTGSITTVSYTHLTLPTT